MKVKHKDAGDNYVTYYPVNIDKQLTFGIMNKEQLWKASIVIERFRWGEMPYRKYIHLSCNNENK